ncbi:hypothetical protein L596_000779 [Steinernema carpocapsae]|uniref:Uncharacterized protein n=1 Tax=Steinernema carpocapsae TaxID=34508 RepID=A0A4U8ULG0_STECR|nr:hypothetical protein L596_000779 [Steinernema carpocapsae]
MVETRLALQKKSAFYGGFADCLDHVDPETHNLKINFYKFLNLACFENSRTIRINNHRHEMTRDRCVAFVMDSVRNKTSARSQGPRSGSSKWARPQSG